jgi:lipopolysaccharide biosynthesis protein
MCGETASLRRKFKFAFDQLIKKLRVSPWRPKTFVTPARLVQAPRPQEVGVFVHVYYAHYLPRIKKILARYARAFPNVVFHFTSTDDEVHSNLIDLSKEFSNVGLVRLCLNRGRNFGPLLVAFQDEIPKFKFIIHLHTKKSLHADKVLVKRWANLLWGNLLENLEVFKNNLSLLRGDERLTLLYPIDLKLFPPHYFTWGRSLENIPLEAVRSSAQKPLDVDRFPFPIGGMFMASSVGLAESLLFRRWSPEDFPEELGQTDATIQHALERLIGYLSWKGGNSPNEQIVFLPRYGAYTTDCSFCSADLTLDAEKT